MINIRLTGSHSRWYLAMGVILFLLFYIMIVIKDFDHMTIMSECELDETKISIVKNFSKS